MSTYILPPAYPASPGSQTITTSGTPTITRPVIGTGAPVVMTLEEIKNLMMRLQTTTTAKGPVLFSSVKDADWLKDATDPTQRLAVQVAPQDHKVSVLALPSGTVFNLSPDDAVTMANQLLDAAATARDNIHEAKDAG